MDRGAISALAIGAISPRYAPDKKLYKLNPDISMLFSETKERLKRGEGEQQLPDVLKYSGIDTVS